MRARTAARAPVAPPHWVLALLGGGVSGLALAASFPSLGWGWLAWFALVPLFIVVARATSLWRALWPGYVAGAVFFGVSCPWIETTVRNYGALTAVTASLVFVMFLILMGSYLALFALAAYWIGSRTGHRLLPLPLVWIAVELFRTYTPMGGFPWNLLGDSQASHAGFMSLTTLTGVYGASLVIAVVNTLAALLLLKLVRWQACPTRWDALAGVALGLLLVWGGWQYHPASPATLPLTARLVQPDTPLDATWTAASLQQFLNRQLELSAPAGSAAASTPAPALIIWPEQPAPLGFALQTSFQAMAAELSTRTHAAFLFGEVTYPSTALGAPDFSKPRNSALLIHADGTVGLRYDKIHLVPFGEYVPLPDWFTRMAGVSKLVQGVGDFIPGRAPVLFSLGGRAFSTLICYESIFPQLARLEVLQGAQFLVNQSDDSWYGRSSAAAQGLQMARVRAIENRRWLLRDTNSGFTAVIDPYGRLSASLPPFQAAALTTGFAPRTQLTFYTRHGDWLAWGCCLVAALLALVGLVRRRHV
ncbi:MAG: apolipoprotein N-acyltransferase [Terriglobales bacterium]